ncbi:hypothetical protein Back11_02600 [Paenibacillus baekrokdamisoli]|uniref:Uncharacterized protein n=1 Tax=Paenibacillus baekrokdamisoli TaxID=1712516 RepID=A0A3G9ISG0_9BACL|nr:hypothetical protein [Paenibacillus baekrokdamisoli]MBB3072630.1 hypothetical protein [Paenibacillus baekrokdamisoli]BBH18915.1 hypothetical protein Back11_02600 [Paenibacillus baekrokdamisoli]
MKRRQPTRAGSLICILLVFIMGAGGCSRTSSAVNSVTIKDMQEPPGLTGLVDNQKVSFILGSYQWHNSIADAPDPSSLVRDQAAAAVVPPNKEMSLTFASKEQPEQILAMNWEEGQIPIAVNGNKIILPSKPGRYVISISGKWSDDRGSYAAAIEIREPEQTGLEASGDLQIPAIKLPEATNAAADMIGLIVYNDQIYTQTATKMDSAHAKEVRGEKLGTTKANIDEWSKQDEFSTQFASSIGVTDVYMVKGYDKDFRIMAYSEQDGIVYSELYECLNGITIHDGKDIFGQLKLSGQVTAAKVRSFSDWNNGVDRSTPLAKVELVESFVEELNNTIPLTSKSAGQTLGDYQNDEQFKELTLELKDGSRTSLILIKTGYIRYGYTDVYFKMDNEIFTSLWEQISN